MIEWLIASGTDRGDFTRKRDVWIGEKWIEYTVLEIAGEKGWPEVVSFLERFVTNPTQTRHELRVRLGVLDEQAAEIFALTVFLCDDLLFLKPTSHAAATPDPAAVVARFFSIASKLPMELQMMLCHRAVGSMKQNIPQKDSELAFRSLAKTLVVATPPPLNPTKLHPQRIFPLARVGVISAS